MVIDVEGVQSTLQHGYQPTIVFIDLLNLCKNKVGLAIPDRVGEMLGLPQTDPSQGKAEISRGVLTLRVIQSDQYT